MIIYMFIIASSYMIDTRCPEPLIVTVEDERNLTWTEEDYKVLPRATAGCIKAYGERSCLVKITKVGERAYNAVCRKYND